MSAHGPVLEANQITPADHAFDPTSKEDANLLINGFLGLRHSKDIDTSQASFFLNKAFLDRLLTESRDGRKEDQGISPDWFSGLKVYFGLDDTNKIVLLMERAIFDSKSKRSLRYKKVPQTISVRWIGINKYEDIDYAIIPVNKDGVSVLKLIDTNSETYTNLRTRFKAKFKNSPSVILVNQPDGIGPPVQFSTFVAGYFLGKTRYVMNCGLRKGRALELNFF